MSNKYLMDLKIAPIPSGEGKNSCKIFLDNIELKGVTGFKINLDNPSPSGTVKLTLDMCVNYPV